MPWQPVVIIESGRVADGAPAQLKSRFGTIVFSLGFGSQADTETAWKVLAAEGYQPEHAGPIQVRSSSGSGAVTQVLRTLGGQVPDPVSVAVHEPTMDDVFLTLTQGGKAA